MLIRPLQHQVGARRWPKRASVTKAWVQPLSNHTSRMSPTGSQSAGSRLAPRKAEWSAVNQASAPCSAKAARMRSLTAGSMQPLAGAAVEVERDRHPPGPLAGDYPIGPPLHHGSDAVDGPGGKPAHGVDGGKRAVAEGIVLPFFTLRQKLFLKQTIHRIRVV